MSGGCCGRCLQGVKKHRTNKELIGNGDPRITSCRLPVEGRELLICVTQQQQSLAKVAS